MASKEHLVRAGWYAAWTLSHTLSKRLMQSKKYFTLWEKQGYHITPVHFYEPVIDTRSLSLHKWGKSSEMVGVDMNPKSQLTFLDEIAPRYSSEFTFPQSDTGVPYEFHLNNGYFESVDVEIMHCMIRHKKPKLIIEIGSGNSTYLMARACRMNAEKDRKPYEILAIEPFPNETLRIGFPGLTGLIQKPVGWVEPAFFNPLGKDDILSIDSNHVIKTGNDVIYENLDT
jgi:hypothetical protein